jgi:hypothetical protein
MPKSKRLTPAQAEVLTLAAEERVTRSLYSPTRWYAQTTYFGRPHAVTATVEALIKAGLLETGAFVALGTPRLAVVTDAGRVLLDTLNNKPEGE